MIIYTEVKGCHDKAKKKRKPVLTDTAPSTVFTKTQTIPASYLFIVKQFC
jgi:hypothetical protein